MAVAFMGVGCYAVGVLMGFVLGLAWVRERAAAGEEGAG